MFVIFGSKTRAKEIQSGNFECPYEKAKRPYGLFQQSEWFTLFFIPIFKWRNGDQYVECASCRTRYPIDVIELRA